MGVRLERLWQESRKKYKMECVAGSQGIQTVIEWVHIIEDLDVADFLHGQELVFTTGIAAKGESWLYDLVRRLRENGAGGLVVNLGPYITSIPRNVKEYCEDKTFPLLTIPWEVRLVDVTREFSVRINEYERKVSNLLECVEDALAHPDMPQMYEEDLEFHGYEAQGTYRVLMLYPDYGELNQERRERYVRMWKSMLSFVNEKIVVFCRDGAFCFLLYNESSTDVQGCIGRILQHGRSSQTDMRLAVGPVVEGARQLHYTYERARRTLRLTKKLKKELLYYDDLGVYKIVMEVGDEHVLSAYVDSVLGRLMESDAKRHTEYVDLLRQYLESDCSIQAMAEKYYCHRNTVSYNIRKIRELLPFDLHSMQNRTQILLAYQIMDFL